MLLKYLFFNLHHFEGEGEGAATGVDGAETGAEAGLDNDGADTDVRDADVEEAIPDRDKEFEALIKGDYKDAFAKRTQKMIDKRYAKSRAAEEKLAEYEDALYLIFDRYGVSDIKALKEAIEKDDDLISEKAAEAGMSNSAYRKYTKLERAQKKADEAAVLQAEEVRKARIAEAAERLSLREKEIRKIYPDFDIVKEYKNSEFKAMVDSGVDMEKAYKALHYDELMSGAIRTAKTKAKMEVAADISARGRRPRENGVGKATPGIPNFDINKSTKEQREKIERAIMKGERVTMDRIPEILSRK